MRADDLEKTLGPLGWTFIVGMFFQLTIDGRPVLLPFFAAACVALLWRLVPYRALSGSRWFAVTLACAAITVAGGVVMWIPALDPAGLLLVVGFATIVGPAAWAGVLSDWSTAQGWMPPAAKARDAQRWLLAPPLLLALALSAFVLVTSPAPVDPDSGYSPASVLGRPFHGWAPGVVLLAVAVLSIVGLLKLRGASQLVRHSLRAQPDALLVDA